MKKLTSLLFTGMFTISSLCVIAQENTVALQKKGDAGSFLALEKFSPTSSFSPVTVDERINRRFLKDFPGKTDAVWGKNGSGYVVRFNVNGIQNWAFLNKKGICYGTMRYYHEKDLPASVRSMVKSNNYDFTISSVKEITQGLSTAYLVTIEKGETWKVVRIVDREMDIYEEHTKVPDHK